LLFVWLIGGLAVIVAALALGALARHDPRTQLRAALGAAARRAPLLALCVFAGLSALAPLLLFNAQTGGTFATLGDIHALILWREQFDLPRISPCASATSHS
jgi:hypothetical protein